MLLATPICKTVCSKMGLFGGTRKNNGPVRIYRDDKSKIGEMELYPRGRGHSGIVFSEGYYFPSDSGRYWLLAISPFTGQRSSTEVKEAIEGILKKQVTQTIPPRTAEDGKVPFILRMLGNHAKNNGEVTGEGGKKSPATHGAAILETSTFDVVLEVSEHFLTKGGLKEILTAFKEQQLIGEGCVEEIMDNVQCFLEQQKIQNVGNNDSLSM